LAWRKKIAQQIFFAPENMYGFGCLSNPPTCTDDERESKKQDSNKTGSANLAAGPQVCPGHSKLKKGEWNLSAVATKEFCSKLKSTQNTELAHLIPMYICRPQVAIKPAYIRDLCYQHKFGQFLPVFEIFICTCWFIFSKKKT
jgi:hypothetical protein